MTGYADYELINPILGVLISKGLCNYRDLKESLTYDDCIKLYDIALVDSYNEHLAYKKAEVKK